jgi:WD40 repeat protein
VEALAISPQDRYLAASYCEESAVEVRPVCRKNLIRFWDLSTMQPLEVTLSESKHDWIRSLVFHPDGKQLISGSYDGSLLVWNFLEGKLVAEPEFRYPGGITSLAFLPGSSLLASGGTSGKLVLWEPSSYQPIGQPLEGAAAAIFSLAFDPVGKVLYSGDEIGNILKWNVDFQSWIERSCQLAGRNLTPEELAQYLPGKPAGYKTCPQYP